MTVYVLHTITTQTSSVEHPAGKNIGLKLSEFHRINDVCGLSLRSGVNNRQVSNLLLLRCYVMALMLLPLQTRNIM